MKNAWKDPTRLSVQVEFEPMSEPMAQKLFIVQKHNDGQILPYADHILIQTLLLTKF